MWHAYEECFMLFDLVLPPLWLPPWFVLLSTCLHIMICHPTICAILVNLPYITLCFASTAYLILCGINNALLTFVVVIPSSHNIVASLCYYNVDHFIHAIAIIRYDCKLPLNIVVKKLSMVGTWLM
jgi:hypothetical protein